MGTEKYQLGGNGSNGNQNNCHQGKQSTLNGGFKNECKIYVGNE